MRLPVKDLLRFRCVSKFFKSVIDSPDFIKQHLSHSQKTSTNLHGLFETVKFVHPVLFNLSRSIDSVSVEIVNRPPSCHQTLVRDVVGSCNGLLALSCKCSLAFLGYDQEVILWNPLTAKFKVVDSPIPFKSQTSYGFGYDPKSDDYKLVRIAIYDAMDNNHPNQLTFAAAIYSLKTDSWKYMGKRWTLNCRNDIWQKVGGGVLVNNALHWGVFDKEVKKIVAFDLVKEKIHFVPALKRVEGHASLKLSVFDEHLTLSSNDQSGTYVWMMEEYGVKNSWTMLLYFDWFSVPGKWLQNRFGVFPLAYSRDGDKLLLNHRGELCDLHWCDLSIDDLVESVVYGNEVKRKGDIKTFVGSLVSPDENTDWVKLKRKQALTDMKRKSKRARVEEGKN